MENIFSRKNLSQFSILMAFIVILRSAEPWFLWGDTMVYNMAILMFLGCRVLLMKKISSRVVVFFLFLYLFYVWIGVYQASRLLGLLTSLLKRFLPLLFIFMMTRAEHIRLRTITINVFSLIILVSLVAYILMLCGFHLPYVQLNHPLNTWYPPFLNYYFFVTELNVGEYLRFRSVFTEPGHLGMFCALFLYINGYSLRKPQNVILLVALILSLSLAAYVLLVVGWFIYSVMLGVSWRKLANMLLVGAFFVGAGWLYLSSRSGEVFQTLILDRLTYDEKKGLKGNNRNTYDFTRVYNLLSTSEYLVGKGSDYMKDRFGSTANSSYRNFIMTNGLIGLILMHALFLSVVYVFPSRLAFGLFLLYAVSFVQRPYWLWEVESYMYLCAVVLFYYETIAVKRGSLSRT